VKDRDKLRTFLSEARIGTGIHYPIPLHLQKAYKDLGYREGDFPASEKAAARILSLPMFPGLASDQQDRIAQRVLDFVYAEPDSGNFASARVPSRSVQGG
jgi:dTDP-4-amino-4,6-dideoxygalactose transaminase